jgi:hypothetical protein
MNVCPNKSSQEWKDLMNLVGYDEVAAMGVYIINNDIPSVAEATQIIEQNTILDSYNRPITLNKEVRAIENKLLDHLTKAGVFVRIETTTANDAAVEVTSNNSVRITLPTNYNKLALQHELTHVLLEMTDPKDLKWAIEELKAKRPDLVAKVTNRYKQKNLSEERLMKEVLTHAIQGYADVSGNRISYIINKVLRSIARRLGLSVNEVRALADRLYWEELRTSQKALNYFKEYMLSDDQVIGLANDFKRLAIDTAKLDKDSKLNIRTIAEIPNKTRDEAVVALNTLISEVNDSFGAVFNLVSESGSIANLDSKQLRIFGNLAKAYSANLVKLLSEDVGNVLSPANRMAVEQLLNVKDKFVSLYQLETVRRVADKLATAYPDGVMMLPNGQAVFGKDQIRATIEAELLKSTGDTSVTQYLFDTLDESSDPIVKAAGKLLFDRSEEARLDTLQKINELERFVLDGTVTQELYDKIMYKASNGAWFLISETDPDFYIKHDELLNAWRTAKEEGADNWKELRREYLDWLADNSIRRYVDLYYDTYKILDQDNGIARKAREAIQEEIEDKIWSKYGESARRNRALITDPKDYELLLTLEHKLKMLANPLDENGNPKTGDAKRIADIIKTFQEQQAAFYTEPEFEERAFNRAQELAKSTGELDTFLDRNTRLWVDPDFWEERKALKEEIESMETQNGKPNKSDVDEEIDAINERIRELKKLFVNNNPESNPSIKAKIEKLIQERETLYKLKFGNIIPVAAKQKLIEGKNPLYYKLQKLEAEIEDTVTLPENRITFGPMLQQKVQLEEDIFNIENEALKRSGFQNGVLDTTKLTTEENYKLYLLRKELGSVKRQIRMTALEALAKRDGFYEDIENFIDNPEDWFAVFLGSTRTKERMDLSDDSKTRFEKAKKIVDKQVQEAIDNGEILKAQWIKAGWELVNAEVNIDEKSKIHMRVVKKVAYELNRIKEFTKLVNAVKNDPKAGKELKKLKKDLADYNINVDPKLFPTKEEMLDEALRQLGIIAKLYDDVMKKPVDTLTEQDYINLYAIHNAESKMKKIEKEVKRKSDNNTDTVLREAAAGRQLPYIMPNGAINYDLAFMLGEFTKNGLTFKDYVVAKFRNRQSLVVKSPEALVFFLTQGTVTPGHQDYDKFVEEAKGILQSTEDVEITNTGDKAQLGPIAKRVFPFLAQDADTFNMEDSLSWLDDEDTQQTPDPSSNITYAYDFSILAASDRYRFAFTDSYKFMVQLHLNRISYAKSTSLLFSKLAQLNTLLTSPTANDANVAKMVNGAYLAALKETIENIDMYINSATTKEEKEAISWLLSNHNVSKLTKEAIDALKQDTYQFPDSTIFDSPVITPNSHNMVWVPKTTTAENLVAPNARWYSYKTKDEFIDQKLTAKKQELSDMGESYESRAWVAENAKRKRSDPNYNEWYLKNTVIDRTTGDRIPSEIWTNYVPTDQSRVDFEKPTDKWYTSKIKDEYLNRRAFLPDRDDEYDEAGNPRPLPGKWGNKRYQEFMSTATEAEKKFYNYVVRSYLNSQKKLEARDRLGYELPHVWSQARNDAQWNWSTKDNELSRLGENTRKVVFGAFRIAAFASYGEIDLTPENPQDRWFQSASGYEFNVLKPRYVAPMMKKNDSGEWEEDYSGQETDLVRMMKLWQLEVNQYAAYADVIDELEMATDLMQSRDERKLDTAGQTIMNKMYDTLGIPDLEGTQSTPARNSAKMLRSHLDLNIYKKKRSQLNVLETFGLDSEKTIGALLKWNALRSLTLNINSSFTTLFQATSLGASYAAASDFFFKGAYVGAELEYTNSLADMMKDVSSGTVTSKPNLINQWFNTFQNVQEAYNFKGIKDRTAMERMFKTSSLFFLSNLSEHKVQTTFVIAALKSLTINEDGELVRRTDKAQKSFYEALTVDSDGNPTVEGYSTEQVKKMIVEANGFISGTLTQLNGNYSPDQKVGIQRNIAGDVVLQFRKFIKPGWNAHWKKLTYSPLKRDYEEGILTSFFTVSAQAMREFSTNKAEFSARLRTMLTPKPIPENATEQERAEITHQNRVNRLRATNLMIVLYRTALYISLKALGTFLTALADDDEIKNMPVFKTLIPALALSTRRASSELAFYISVDDALTILRSPAAALSTIEEVGGAAVELYKTTTWYVAKGTLREFKTGKRKGENRLVKELLDLSGPGRFIDQVTNMQETNKQLNKSFVMDLFDDSKK